MMTDCALVSLSIVGSIDCGDFLRELHTAPRVQRMDSDGLDLVVLRELEEVSLRLLAAYFNFVWSMKVVCLSFLFFLFIFKFK